MSARDPHRVLWLDQALSAERARPCPELGADRGVDVCIVGGGYTGLWTALEIRKRAADATVLVLEASGCGFGASGRNGGWAVAWYDKLDQLVEEFGESQGLWLAERSREAVVDLERRTSELGIDCDYRRCGALYAAASAAQEGAWSSAASAAKRYGRGDRYRPLERGEAQRRSGVSMLRDGADQTDTAIVHPGRLARGLRRAALERGIEIAEASQVVAIERTRPVRVRTARASVTAEHVVLATGAWSARIRELRRAIVPFASHIVASAPAPERVAELGWTDGALIGDLAELVHYAHVTADGRIAFGRGGGAIGAAGRVDDRHFADARWAQIVAADFRRWFPSLADVPITHRWGGPIDHSPGYFPFVGSLGDHGNIHYGAGYSGDGVAQSTLIASILAARVLAIESDDSRCALAAGPRAYLPPEPLRSLGGRAVREAVLRAEARESRGLDPHPVAAGLRRLSRFRTPRQLEPRLRARAAR
jgi:glycine/D-amino acid oxidase-like deaminating enzyme